MLELIKSIIFLTVVSCGTVDGQSPRVVTRVIEENAGQMTCDDYMELMESGVNTKIIDQATIKECGLEKWI